MTLIDLVVVSLIIAAILLYLPLLSILSPLYFSAVYLFPLWYTCTLMYEMLYPVLVLDFASRVYIDPGRGTFWCLTTAKL